MTAKKNVETVGENVGFERIRRITGYLVGTMDRWNNAKRAEEHDRVKHSTSTMEHAGLPPPLPRLPQPGDPRPLRRQTGGA